MERIHNLIGKNVLIYDPKDRKKYSANEIGSYLKRFKLFEALRLIGEISYTIKNKGSETAIDGIPISDAILSYIAMRLIEHSNDYRSAIMTVADLLKACDMYFGLADPIQNDLNAQACLIRFGSVQFDYDRECRNLLPRTLLIYRELWPQLEKSRGIDIDWNSDIRIKRRTVLAKEIRTARIRDFQLWVVSCISHRPALG